MLRVELAAKILVHCTEADLSVAELMRTVGGGHDKTVAAIRELQKRSLLVKQISAENQVGRPRQYLRPTALGKQFVRDYGRLQSLSLRSNENDIRKALHQADLAGRLIHRGISPYIRFQEINQLARNIASTAKAKHHTR